MAENDTGGGNEPAGVGSKRQVPHAFKTLLDTALEFAAHVVILIMLLAGFEFVHWYYDWRNPNAGPIFLGITMADIFKAFDLALIVGILGVGTWKVLNVYRR